MVWIHIIPCGIDVQGWSKSNLNSKWLRKLLRWCDSTSSHMAWHDMKPCRHTQRASVKYRLKALESSPSVAQKRFQHQMVRNPTTPTSDHMSRNTTAWNTTPLNITKNHHRHYPKIHKPWLCLALVGTFSALFGLCLTLFDAKTPFLDIYVKFFRGQMADFP